MLCGFSLWCILFPTGFSEISMMFTQKPDVVWPKNGNKQQHALSLYFFIRFMPPLMQPKTTSSFMPPLMQPKTTSSCPSLDLRAGLKIEMIWRKIEEITIWATVYGRNPARVDWNRIVSLETGKKHISWNQKCKPSHSFHHCHSRRCH